MKKYVFFLLVLFYTAGSEISAQVQWGIRAGGNLSSMLLEDEGEYIKTKLQPGFHIGGTADVFISDKFSLQPALLFTTKGFKLDDDGFADALYGVDYIKFMSYHIDLPVNVVFKPQLGNGNLLLGAGPYISYGLGGRWKAGADGMSVKGKLKFTNDIADVDSFSTGGNNRTLPYMKPFDFGANILLGYEFRNNFYFQLNGQLGLVDVDPAYNGVSDERSSVKNVGGSISIGYKF